MTTHQDGWKNESGLVTDLANILSQCLIPLFTGSRKGKPQFVGTGFLVSSQTNHYLVSAAHVFDEGIGDADLWYYIEPTMTLKLWGKLQRTILPASGTRKSDRVDVGVLKLEGSYLPPYPKVGRYPIPLDSLKGNVIPRKGKQYLIFGFPASKHHVNPIGPEIASELCIYRTYSSPIASYAKLRVHESTHIVLAFDQEKSIDPDSKMRSFPKPVGMSGSPVWLLLDEEGANEHKIPPIVGIVIEHHKSHRALLATDIGAALALMGGA